MNFERNIAILAEWLMNNPVPNLDATLGGDIAHAEERSYRY